MPRSKRSVVWSVAICACAVLGAQFVVDAWGQDGSPLETSATSPVPPEQKPIEAAATEGDAGVEAATEAEPKPTAVSESISYRLKNYQARSVAKLLAESFASQAKIAADDRTQSIIVAAPADVQAKIKAAIVGLDIDPATLPQGDVPAETKEVKLYSLDQLMAEELNATLATHFSQATISAERSTNSLIVFATPSAHQVIEALIRALDRPRSPKAKTAADPLRPSTERGAAPGSTRMSGDVATFESYGRLKDALGLSRQQVDATVQALRAAKSDDDKQSAMIDLRQLLTGIFDLDMQSRAQQVDEIERRIEKLRRQYQERVKVKDQIVDLQLKVLENEAAGLGFPSETELPGTSPDAAKAMPAVLNRAVAEAARAELQAIGELMKKGHFVVSTDAKAYAYVVTGAVDASGTAEIRVCDIDTRKVRAIADVETPVGPLQFTDKGVATREADGSLKLRIPLGQLTGPAAAGDEPNGAGDIGSTVAASRVAPSSASFQHQTVLGEYILFRDRHAKAKAELARAEAAHFALLADAKGQRPDSNVEDVKKQHPAAWDAVVRAREDWKDAQHLYETRLRLLRIDIREAEVALRAARSKHETLKALFERNATSKVELDQQQAAFDSAELEVERALARYELFKSIGDGAADIPNISNPSDDESSTSSN